MFLFIDTSQLNAAVVALFSSEQKFGQLTQQSKSGGILRAIEKLLKEAKEKPSVLQGIVVVAGPGGFSSLRSGIAVANTLGEVLQIPVVGVQARSGVNQKLFQGYALLFKRKKKFTPVVPLYGHEPNITVKPRPYT